MSKILVFQHAANEGLGTIADELAKVQITTETIMVSNDTVFPSSVKLEEYNGFIFLGGPMGVYEEHKYHWLTKELMVLKEILRQKKPVLGICLGAQLIAKAAGAKVYRGAKKEIGWYPIQLDDWFYKRNPLFFQIDHTKSHTVFQSHGDTFDIPTDGYRLAWNDNYNNQAFCYQGNAIGLQFHVEMNEEMVRDWMTEENSRFDAFQAGFDPDAIIAETEKHLPAMKELCHKMMIGFASLVRERVRRAA